MTTSLLEAEAAGLVLPEELLAGTAQRLALLIMVFLEDVAST
jgi:hypothetical protein